MSFDLKSKEKVVSAEFETWQNIRQLKAPFNLTVGFGLSGDAATPAAAAVVAPAPVPPPAVVSIARNEVPKIAPAANEGAASVDAAVNQMNAAFAAAKGRDLLAVVFPDDRNNFALEMATAVVFSTLALLDDPKAAEK